MRANFIKRQTATKLHLQGYSNKTISKKLHISEKTICKWLKDLQNINYTTLLSNLYKRFNDLLNNQNTDIKDIHNLNNVIASIEKRLKVAKSN